MSANPISDKELASLLRLVAAALDDCDLPATELEQLSQDCDLAADLLDARRGI